MSYAKLITDSDAAAYVDTMPDTGEPEGGHRKAANTAIGLMATAFRGPAASSIGIQDLAALKILVDDALRYAVMAAREESAPLFATSRVADPCEGTDNYGEKETER